MLGHVFDRLSWHKRKASMFVRRAFSVRLLKNRIPRAIMSYRFAAERLAFGSGGIYPFTFHIPVLPCRCGAIGVLGRRIFPCLVPENGIRRRHPLELIRGMRRPSDLSGGQSLTSDLSPFTFHIPTPPSS